MLAGRNFLFLMCAVMGFVLIWGSTTKFHMLTIKGKKEDSRMENLNLVNKNRMALSVMFSVEKHKN